MMKTKTVVHLLMILVMVFLSAELHAATPVSGAIAANTTWTAAASPYYVTGSVTVNGGVTLTVEAGTVVKFAQGQALFVSSGATLLASGSSGQQITFTDYRDDGAGGDTNGDGSATTAVPGGWRGIEVAGGGAASLSYCTVSYAGSSYANVYKTGSGAFSVSNCTVSDSINHGIYLNGATAASTISSSTISDNLQNGIFADGASPAAISGNIIWYNGKYGIYAAVASPSTFSVDSNDFKGNVSAPIGVTAASSGISIGTANTYTGPRFTLVESGTVPSSQTWGSATAGLVYYVAGNVTVAGSQTLTIQPQTVVKFAQNVVLSVSGTLTSVASSGKEIVFTDFRDDTAGGDSNGNGTATSPAPGWWRGIEVNDFGSATLTYSFVRYGGSSNANVYKTGTSGTLSIGNSRITASGNYGIYLNSAALSTTITNSEISSNILHGIYAAGTSPAAISGCTISSNGVYGIYANVSTPSAFSAAGSSFSNNGRAPIGVTAAGSGIAIAAGNTFTGKSYIHVEGGAIASSQTWGNGSPAVYYIADNVSINGNQTLTIQPATVVKFAPDRALLFTGSLNATGTGENRIVFTDFRDDSAGGDSNLDGSASAPAPGGWRGIELNNFASGTFDYCDLRYGSSSTAQQAMIYKNGEGAVTISNSTITSGAYRGVSLVNAGGVIAVTSSIIRNNAAYGMYLSGAVTVPTITKSQISGSNIGIFSDASSNPVIGGSDGNGNDIFNNITYSVQNNSTAPTINARFNWWGADAPSLTGINKVSNYVDTGDSVAASLFGNTSFATGAFKTPIGNVTLSGTTTWTVANSPYYVTDSVTVAAAGTLIVEDGVVVKFAQNIGLWINGTLNATGATFTDYRDDSAGGDTNGDGSATLPAPGWWRGINVMNGASATLSNCTVRYAGYNNYDAHQANIYKTGSGNLTVSNSIVNSGAYYGIYLNGATGSNNISGSTISNNSYDGILANGATAATINGGNTFAGNGRYGIYAGVTTPASFVVSANTFSYNSSAPIGVTAASSGIAVAASNTYNGARYILVEDGTFTSSQTWGNGTDSTYYLAGNVTVPAGAILTVHPATVVKTVQNVGLWISGTLNAPGTSDNRIHFTHFRDDTAGGDTNGDGSATLPTPGWWRGINVLTGGNATLSYCIVRYAGYNNYDAYQANIYKTGSGNLTVSNSSASNGAYYGIYLNAASGTNSISGSTISNNSYDGILANGATAATINGGNTFAGNGRYGIYAGVSAPATFVVSANTFSYNSSAPIGVTAAGSGIAVAASNTYNGARYIQIEDGTLSGNQTWGNGTDSTYYFAGNVTVPAGSVLTVNPATVVKTTQNVGLWIDGTLNATGTSDGKIHFTHFRDDASGGDTNGDGTSSVPTPGWWRGIIVRNGGNATFDNCIVRYAGYNNYDDYRGNIYKTGSGNLTVSNSTIGNNAYYGIYLSSATGTNSISNTTISNNSDYGLYINNSSGSSSIIDTIFSNNYDGIYASGNSPYSVTGSSFSYNRRYGIYNNAIAAAAVSISSSAFNANSSAPVQLTAVGSGAVVSDDTTGITGALIVEGGSIGDNITWASNRVYYLTSPLTVPAGATLTVPAGRVVKFAQYALINVYGTLNAIGTSGSPIYFTDYRDDIGGDTNASADQPAAGWWWGLRLMNGGNADIRYATIRYSAQAYFGHWLGDYTAPVYKIGAGTLNLANSTVSDNSGYGLWFKDTTTTATVDSNTIQNSSSYGIVLGNAGSGVTINKNIISNSVANDGIHSDNSSPIITENSISTSGRYGLYVRGAALPATVSKNTLTANAAGHVGVETDSSNVVIDDDNVFSGPIYIVAGGTISRDTTWVNNRVYYVNNPFSIAASKTLTVPAGRVVKFAQYVFINVAGTLNAVGTSGSPIYFTDYRDDIGGDTNTSTDQPAAGWWWGLRLLNGGNADIQYATIRYANQGYFGHWLGDYSAPIYKIGTGTLNLANSTVSDNTGNGLWFKDTTTTATVDSNTIQNNSSYGIVLGNASSGVTISKNSISNSTSYDGIHSDNSSPVITENSISSSGRYGLYVRGSALPATVSKNTLATNTAGNVGVETDSSNVVIDDDNVFSGPIYIIAGGTISRATTWVNNRVYYVNNPFTVAASQTLTVPAGRVVKFAQNVFINVSGTLSAIGTSGSPIYFTDYRDDIGGDTNASADQPAAGWWWGLRLLNGGNADIRYATIRYSAQAYFGHWLGDYSAPIYKIGTGTLNLANSTISDNSSYGLWFKDTTVTATVDSNTIQNNSGYGIVLGNAGSGVTINKNSISNSTNNDGIHSDNSSPVITENNISSSGRYGLYVRGAAIPATISKNTLTANTAGHVGVETDSSNVVIDDDNVFTGPIYIIAGGTISRVTTWVNNRVYYVTQPFSIAASQTLTVPAGRIVKFAQYVFINVYGTLSAVGTSGSPIYFTDYRDDIGGDTNASADQPAAGWWWGLRLMNGGNADIRYATIRYSAQAYFGHWLGDYSAPIYKIGTGTLNLANSTVSDNSGYGLWFRDTSVTATVDSTTVKNNTSHGFVIENAGSGVSLTGSILEINGNSGIYAGNSSPLILSNTIRYNVNSGIYLNGAGALPTVFKNSIFANAIGVNCTASANPLIGGTLENGNNIFNNSSHGVQNTTSGIQVNAKNNWWGSVTGPLHAALNPLGTGNAVSDYVDFEPYQSNPAVPIAIETVSPSIKAFGHVTTGTASAPQIFTITNSGSENLIFSAVSITGTHANQFRITQNLCDAQTIPTGLATGESCTVTALFEPTVSKPAQAQLTIVTNDIYTPTLAAPLTGTGSILLPFRDNFTGGTKSAEWFVTNEDQSLYSLTDSSGYLRITTTPTNFSGLTNNAKNLFVVALPNGVTSFVATTKLLFPNASTPNQNYQQGGVSFLADKNGAPDLDNYLRAQYAFDSGRRFETTYDINGAPGAYQGSLIEGITDTTPVWIRIIRKGTDFTAEYSLDGSTYTLITSMSGPWNISFVGLHALNGDQSAAPAMPVDVDYFEVYELPSITVSPSSKAFSSVSTGESSLPENFVISNAGPGPLTISAIAKNGTDPAMFTINNGTCGTLPATISPNSSCTFSVTFTPTTDGLKTANIAVTSNDIDVPVTNLQVSGTTSYLLTLTVDGTGAGSVTSNSSFVCTSGNTCSQRFDYGTIVYLYATSNLGSHFVEWGGDCTGSNCSASMKSSKTVTAAFDINIYTILASAGPNGSITNPGNNFLTYDSSTSFTVTPDSGYHIVAVLIDGVSQYVANSKTANTYFFNNIVTNHTISVTFAADTTPQFGTIRIQRDASEYQTIQDAYNAAEDGDTIQLLNGSLAGPAFFALRNISIAVKGGFEFVLIDIEGVEQQIFSDTNPGITIIPAKVSMSAGRVVMEHVAVK